MKTTSLRTKLTRASMLTTLVALLLSAGSLLVYELHAYRSGWVSDLRTQADLLAHSTAAALVFDDPRSAQQNLALLKERPDIRVAAIFGERGVPFAAYTVRPGEALPPGAATPVPGGQRFEGSVLEVWYPIEHDGERVGTVYLAARHDVWDRAGNYVAILAGVTSASLVLAYLVFGRLERSVTRPLFQMTGVAQQVIARRDWTLRAVETPDRDVSVLVEAFNGVLSEVQARTGELERSNTQLASEMVERGHAEDQLRLADRRKDEFLATLAHELRNPLAAMMAAMALLKRGADDAALRDKASAILGRQLRHMTRLIDDLLDVSRVTTGKLSLRREPLDLTAVLRMAVELSEPQARLRKLVVDLQLPGTACPMVGDAARLAQVFSNLLNNACRYTDAGGHVQVAMQLGEGEVLITVHDTGIGIEPSMQQRIFEPFEQADRSLGRGSAGLGIGLTLARQLAQLHGGDISVHSEGLGQGSCFTVRLPLPPVEAQAPAALVPPPVAQAYVPRLRILVADDNVDFASSIADVLAAMGHHVAVANDGAAALAAITGTVPDVALLDIGMPLLDGYEVARRLRSNPAMATVKLVAVTGWGQAADRLAAQVAGFDHHLVKPVTAEDLMRVFDAHRSAGAAAAFSAGELNADV
jgi:signal transduction histidine kinase/ActR/RegA family two-component response regulator